LIVLYIVVLIRAPMNKNTGIELPTSASVIPATLILGKYH